jgi:hypothetical protein
MLGPPGYQAEELAKAADQAAPDVGFDLEPLEDQQ